MAAQRAVPAPRRGRVAIRRRRIVERGAADIPPRSIRKDGFAFSTRVYRQRNPVERFFNRIKQFRNLATRYDRQPEADKKSRYWDAQMAQRRAKWEQAETLN